MMEEEESPPIIQKAEDKIEVEEENQDFWKVLELNSATEDGMI